MKNRRLMQLLYLLRDAEQELDELRDNRASNDIMRLELRELARELDTLKELLEEVGLQDLTKLSISRVAEIRYVVAALDLPF